MTKQELESLAGAGLPVGAETGLEQAELGRIEPVPPPQAGQEELTDMAELAEALAERILSEPDDRTFIRTVTASAEGVQSLAGSEFVLLRNSLGQVMDRMSRDEDRGIPADLKALREIMDRINPYPVLERIKKARNSGWLSRALKGLPTVGRLLADIAQRYESVQTQIDAIIDSLHAGSDRLMENALELEERYKNLKVLQHEVQLQAYRLEIIWSRLDRAFGEAEDQEERQRLHRAVVRIARRAQNLRVTEQAFAQMFVTMNTTIDNHENLRDAIQAMVGLTRPVLENGLALRIAQQEEKEIALALEASQDYLGGLMTSIAEDSMANAALVADVANRPLVKFRDLLAGYQVLVNRMDEAAQIESRMLTQAKENMGQLQAMSAKLESLAQSQERARESVRAAEGE